MKFKGTKNTVKVKKKEKVNPRKSDSFQIIMDTLIFLLEPRKFAFQLPVRAGKVSLEPVVFEHAELKSHHHKNGNVLDRSSMDKGPFITKLLDEI
jgi:hypothetical protein